MGLDWHSNVKATKEYKEKYIKEYYAEELEKGEKMKDLLKEHAPDYMKPCKQVGAPKVGDVPDFKEKLTEYLKMRKDDAAEKKSSGDGNIRYIEYWEAMTLEQLIEEEKDKWDCDNCPLLKALNGADSTGSFFVGMTVSSCDFRGKRISADDCISDDLTNEAYEEHTPEEMLAYADRLEEELEYLKEQGCLTKDSYEKYASDFKKDEWAKVTGAVMLTKEEYDSELHWRERDIREAVHWLRTCASMDVSMGTSY